DLVDDMMVTTLASGETFSIDLDTTPPTIIAGGNTAQIIATDVQAVNGVIHAIDTVILPE
ncbi:MAG: fasciclin domain-containing protein, partial [Phaeodactylibacter sp.]|nr:fasciclin domain-containing protein [Phaeodactylibacter sp.]